MPTALPDIRTEGDIKVLVDCFCQKVNQDALLSPIFSAVAAVHWPNHLTSLYDYWSSALFGRNNSTGQPIPQQLAMPARGQYQRQWIGLFSKAVEENFAGDKAEEAKVKARSIALAAE
ncbi:group III truncated hemoglobin [Hymenobacter sp. BT188]|uniref:group III truncated hemoglobin n=1 Tax=Hymenobacter sp. BT188 TaxID=2763504 RepID=UPI00165155A1|nr:group III truncated hemoglobin [Hymenobacter sp. BT188]MBC6606061.1 group III truncated hemoglobin [Hymenobacter sp. BT188]